MELDNLKELWAGIDQKLDRNWQLNLEIIRRTNLDKARNKMRSLTWIISITLAFYILVTLFFVRFTVANWGNLQFMATGIVLGGWSVWICFASIRELNAISKIDYAAPITVLQKQLIDLKLMIIRTLRIVGWIFPFSFAFMILFFKVLFNVDIVAKAPMDWVIWNLIIYLVLFVPLSLWIHTKLHPRNANKKWMHKLLQGNGSQINDAVDFLKEIEDFEKH